MGTSPFAILAVLGLFLAISKVYWFRQARRPSGLPYPSGPWPLPLVGNLFDVPKSEPWKTYASWGKRYGELVHFTVFGQHFVIINSMRVAVDLLEKRSKTYSDRPQFPIINLMGWDWSLGLLPYGQAWRQRRREFHQQFRSEKAVQYRPIIMKKAHQFLEKLLNNPEDFSNHIRQYSASIVMSAVYDYDVTSGNEHFADLAEKSVEMFSNSAFPGATAVNALPALQYLPEWLPGMGFKRYAERCKKLTTEMRNAPFKFVRDRIESGVPTQCLTTELIGRLSDEHGKPRPDAEEVIKDVCAIAYAAGQDTTVSALHIGLLALLLYPEVQMKAHSEIDKIVGNGRLPSYEDRASLPYVDAFVSEVLRWHPVTPLSLSRAAYEDDVYDGGFIPKGIILLMNTWGIHHDEVEYSEPFAFKPERFLNSDGSLGDKYPITAFGLGRRICPGRPLADSVLWTAFVLVFAAFDVQKEKDEYGHDVNVPEKLSDSMVSHPLPFACKIVPRNSQTESLIREIGEIF
ncbi:cytochrome P450 [Heliocybe sulcata]|uniref:Cytochrome P450 n=1 Tax=Heliocybe sulcata TaxID=5364 RepID=A0A5C3MXN1_9AGAM|nr:cytochrome P450 [Heliocybe sulcata]